ncbi:FRG domain-containing protein [Lunatibacter salilacus]|uniref:FRG domain-containing protein n=1 Tax=Lunatibacter salilacus TaxID=2483804 RepID=UPI00131D6739|nr:FRG domain-containing protein [Lunatibacter salilacus]
MQSINITDSKLEYPGFYNIYPIRNEISIHSGVNELAKKEDKTHLLIDDNYGRVLNENINCPYSNSKTINYYNHSANYTIIDELRVPFRKIPVYKFEDYESLFKLISQIEKENPDYEILLRGQTSLYTIRRAADENLFLFGDGKAKEPSFKPSFVRSDFNEFFIYGLWHSQTALMLNDVGIDLKEVLNSEDYIEYQKDVFKIKNSPHFTPISLGFAQHYGLPSVGLDLTKDIKVATWFATNKLIIENDGLAETRQLEDFSESTIFIFRCPKDTVFSHKSIKPKFIENTRPDRQDAWFCHSGWGLSKNQLASYLVCAIGLNNRASNLSNSDYTHYLFPDRSEDLVLNYFMDIKENSKNTGEVKRALNKIYLLK